MASAMPPILRFGGKSGGQKRGQTGRSPISRELGNKSKTVLTGIRCGLWRPSSLSRSQPPQSRRCERSYEFDGSQRSTRVRALAQRADLGLRFSRCQILTPPCHRPPLLPAFHFQHLVANLGVAVNRGARPWPLLRPLTPCRHAPDSTPHNAALPTGANRPRGRNRTVPATRAHWTTAGRSNKMRSVRGCA